MSKHHRRSFHPAIVYFILLVIAILASWIGSIMEMKHAGGNSGLILRSVLDVPGIRWAVRNAAGCIAAAPIGNAMMLFMAIGAGRGSGLFRAIGHVSILSPKERTALWISAVVMILYLSIIVLGIFAGSHLLLGITGKLNGSPLYEGLMFLLMLAVAIPSVVFGFSTDTFRTAYDCVEAFSDLLKPFAEFIITLIVAAQLIGVVSYSGIDKIIGLTDESMRVVSFLIYWLPLPIILISNRIKKTGTN
ncbi:MAG: AbgT family transporter [Bacteroidaceae bacterium]